MLASLLTLALTSGPASAEPGMSFTVYSQPVELRYGQVYNTLQSNGGELLPLPADVVQRYASGEKLMAVKGFDVDMVRVDANGTETQVLLSDHYMHHYILYFGEAVVIRRMFAEARQDGPHGIHTLTGCHGMTGKGVHMFQQKLLAEGNNQHKGVGFGSAAGAEFRHNPQRFPEPFRLLLQRPEVWAPTLHMINTNNSSAQVPPPVSRLLECPCTPQRKFDVEAGTIDGKPAKPPIHCSANFSATGNPSCSLATYTGGWRCCEHNVFVVDTDKECATPTCEEKPADKVLVKFTFLYEDFVPGMRQVESAACCDVTSDEMGFSNIEYDVPQCAPGTPPEQCVYVAETEQPVGYFNDGTGRHRQHASSLGSDLVDLVFAAPHLHWAGISMKLIDPETNEVLCEAHRSPANDQGIIYGNGTAPGDEAGYLVGLKVCVWDEKSARRFRRDHRLRARAVYNATEGHFGVMGLWLMQVSPATNRSSENVGILV